MHGNGGHMVYILLLVGFVFLIKGADFFVEGSSSLARILKIPSVVIGLTLVSMGTSAPEAAVSITAGLSGSSDMSLGNVIGSNIFNLLVVIGASAMIYPIVSHKDILKRDLWWNIGITGFLLLLIFDGGISRLDGICLLLGMVLYLFIVVRSALKNRTEGEPLTVMSVPKSFLYIIAGLAAVIAGGQMVVRNASIIAKTFGMSDALVGLTIVAIGTSLPELVTSIMASRKGDSGIALGNAVGSCIFNILFILGAASVLSPIHVAPELLTDTVILIAVCILITLCARTKKKTSRLEGLILVLLYAVYTGYIIMR